jgi:S-formylglutathione hydrolase FrmB
MQNKMRIGLSLPFTILLLCVISSVNAEKKIVDIPSALMNRSFKACVITPSDYASGRRYSVIYLLHGYSHNFASWSKIVPLENYADTFKLMFVCPDGDYNSWYLDSPIKNNSLFASYISKEVVAFIDANYHTIANAKARAIIGSSMGGHGAVTLLAMHLDVFYGAGSISGIMDLTEFPNEWGIAGVLGPYNRNRQTWRQYSFVGMAEKLIGKYRAIILDCGTSDFALAENRNAHELLQKLKIPHEYIEHGGNHTMSYAAGEIGLLLSYFSKILPPPSK